MFMRFVKSCNHDGMTSPVVRTGDSADYLFSSVIFTAGVRMRSRKLSGECSNRLRGKCESAGCKNGRIKKCVMQ